MPIYSTADIARAFPVPSLDKAHYVPLDEVESLALAFTDLAEQILMACPMNSERSLSLTRLEEAFMWARESKTREQGTVSGP